MTRQSKRKQAARTFQVEQLETRKLLSSVTYNVVDLGAFSSGNGQSAATGLNSSGQVVGYSSVNGGENHPFLYSDGSLTDINPAGGDSQAWSINDSGEIVGKSGDAFIYGNGPLHSIGRLPGGNTSFAYAINNGGQVAGDSLTADSSITHAFLYTNGTMKDLGTLGGAQSNAFGINNHGDVVGLAYAADGVSHAFLYTNGHMVDVGQTWGPAASMARAVNDSGQVVGYGYFLGLQPRHAFVYSNGSITDLQTLGGISSSALAINAQGQIVGDSNTNSGADHAFVYSSGQMQDLNTLISTSSGWSLQQATAINSSGQIAGTGIINGRQHAFLLTPVQVPQTGSISGAVYNDVNSNASRDRGEAGLSGWTVFVDSNNNGRLDAGEPSAVSQSDGSYSIAGLSPGNYTIDEVIKSGYSQTAPAGGTASVSVIANQNADVPAFGNALIPTPPSDVIPPSAQITAPTITSAGASSTTITVVYTDDVAVNVSSIALGNVSVTGPAGALTVTAANVSGGGGNAATVVATYTVAAPGGTWDAADNGSYVVSLKADQVSDTSGNFAGGASGSFTVNVAVATTGNGSDQSFNNGQGVGTNFVTEAILTEPDGKVLAVGRAGDLSSGNSQSVIERLNSDGSLDKTFGSGGMIVSMAGANEAYYALVMQDANHFLVAGTSAGNFVLSRYTLAGKLDGAFGNSGRVVSDFGTTADTARGVAITASGMIVLGGDSGGNLAFARYDASGKPDPNFAQNGLQLYGLGDGTSNAVGAVAVQDDGKVIAVGAQGANVVVVRLTAAGEADGTFGNGGLVMVPGLIARTDLGAPDRSEGLAVQSDGQILVANRTAGGHFGLVRLSSNGAVDSTFGINGLVTANFGGDDDADSILLQSTGQIVVIGTSLQAGGPQAAVAAFDVSGAPLNTFGNSGLLLLSGDITPLKAAAGSISPSSLHIGDIVLRAFGTVTSDGRVIVGTSNEAVAATTSSTLRRLIVPGALASGKAAGTLLGSFGVVEGKIKKFTVTDADGTKITFALSGGTGQIFQSGNAFDLTINDLGKGVVLTITGKGGDGRVSLGDITISGTLKTINARNSDLAGTLHVTGAIGTLSVGNISGSVWSGAGIAVVNAGNLSGNFFATGALGKLKFNKVGGTIASGSGAIASLTATSMDSARILSGANLGADGAVGGTSANADTFGGGAIGTIKISGSITSSFIGAGVNPVDQTFGNSDDLLAGSAGSSLIKSITAKSADSATRFEAGSFGKALLPKIVAITTDPRFKVL